MATSSTLTTCRQTTAALMGPYETGTATSGSTTSSLEIATSPFKSTIAQSGLYKDWWILLPTAAAADQIRACKTYVSSAGTFTPDNNWATAPYALGVGKAVEFHALVEPLTLMTRMINEALKRCALTVEFTLTPVAQATRHSLATQAWIVDELQVYQVGYLGPNETRAQLNPFDRVVRGEVINDGGTLYLQHDGVTFNATDTIWVKALKPAYNHCAAAAGAYGSQNGLALETDVCPVPDDWVAAGAVVEAWRRLDQLLAPGDMQRVKMTRTEAAAWFSRKCREHLREPDRTFEPPLKRWGPAHSTSGVVGLWG